jgi:hypothetical protein
VDGNSSEVTGKMMVEKRALSVAETVGVGKNSWLVRENEGMELGTKVLTETVSSEDGRGLSPPPV